MLAIEIHSWCHDNTKKSKQVDQCEHEISVGDHTESKEVEWVILHILCELYVLLSRTCLLSLEWILIIK